MYKTQLFQWINFAILVGILIYFLKPRVGEFLSGRREKIRTTMEKSKRLHMDAFARYSKANEGIGKIEGDIKALKERLVEMGTYASHAAIERAREMSERIQKETQAMMKAESERQIALMLKGITKIAIENARKKLALGLTEKQHKMLVDETLKTVRRYAKR